MLSKTHVKLVKYENIKIRDRLHQMSRTLDRKNSHPVFGVKNVEKGTKRLLFLPFFLFFKRF
jgi:hypothetical protein